LLRQVLLNIRRKVIGGSIALRLGVGFGAVAVLAVLANLTWEHRVSITRTRTYVPGQIVRQAPPTAVLAPEAAPAASEASRIKVEDADLLEALAQFDRTVVLRAQVPTAANKILLSTATQRMLVQTTTYLSATSGTVPSKKTDLLRAHLHTLQASAETFVKTSDNRRSTFASYGRNFDTMDALLKSTLDHNWTIFGRVIARQSLISMSRDLDDIRRKSAQLSAAGGYEPNVLNTLAASESKFSTTLEHNATGLAKAQGAPWVTQLRDGFSAVVSSRTQLATLDAQASQEFEAVEREVKLLGGLIHSITKASAADLSVQLPVDATPSSPPLLERTKAPPITTASPPYVRVSAQEIRTGPGILSRGLFAAVSAGVLLLLMAISITTVRSIVLPIRQFLVTTGRIATGDATARFERGGLKELDVLAVSLNGMAASLEEAQASAREYQSALELRVEERTRQVRRLAECDLLTGLPNRRQVCQTDDTS
jgi:HAMP domain